MKLKTYAAIVLSLATVCAAGAALTACGEKLVPPSAPEEYTVVAATDADYTITVSDDSAERGETITVTVTVNNPDKYLTGVSYNGTPCSEDDGSYSFTMPSEDVTVTATLDEYQEQPSDGSGTGGSFASFYTGNPTTIVPAESGTTDLTIILNGSWMTSLNYDISSSDEDVIPADAIEVSTRTSGTSNVITSAILSIDRTAISEGSTWLTMNFKSGNTSQKGTIVVKMTVSQSFALTKWTENIQFDVSRLDLDDGTKIHVHLYDRDYVEGSDAKSYQEFNDLEVTDDTVTVSIEYVKGHEYSLEFAVADGTTYTYHDLSEVVGSGSTQSGFNQFVDGSLTFVEDGATLKIDVLTTTHT